MKKTVIILAALCVGSFSSFAQSKTKAAPAVSPKASVPAKPSQDPTDTVFFDESFEDAGTGAADHVEIRMAPKFYKAGEAEMVQPIALTTAKKEAIELARARPTKLRKDCINLIYTVDPIYSDGTITGAVKGTIIIKWLPTKKQWVFNYLKYQLVNIDQNACVFMYEAR